MSKKGDELETRERDLLKILKEHHMGQTKAAAGEALAAELGVTSRSLRDLVNHMIIDHLLPIGTSTTRGHSGYFMIENPEEAREFYQAFRSRGLTGLVKAARIEKTSLLEMSLQLTLDFHKEEDKAKIPGVGEAMTRLLSLFRKNPTLYSKEIKALESEARPLLVDRDKMLEINQAAKHLQELTGGYVQ